MHTIHITLLLAGICALFQCLLTALVVRRRVQSRISLLDGDDERLRRRIRAHGNFTETVPLALLLMALLEQGGLHATWLWALGGCLLLGRALHAWGLLNSGKMWARSGGMALTLATLSIAGASCIGAFLGQ
jgi:uncharacterized protein